MLKLKRTSGRVFLVLLTALLMVSGDALAIIGRPLTPMSYAGVARRTTRRAAYVGAASYGAAAYGSAAYAMPAGAVTALPGGCAIGLPCAGIVYRPASYGATVVYVPQ